MKKFLAVVLALCLTAFGTMTAFAAETSISLEYDNLGRGAGLVDLSVIKNADGSITSKTSNISFYLPEAIPAGETITVHVTGSSDGDFRMWLIDTNETTNSDQYQMSLNGFTSGDFDQTFTLTATAEGTEFFFKAPTFDGKIDNLTVKSLTITVGAAPAAPAAAETTAAAPAATTAAPSVPKTGVVAGAAIYMALAAAAATGFVATKKKENE